VEKAPVKPKVASRTAAQTKPKTLPPYNVVLLDDDDHSYAYVIEMLGRLFGYSVQRAFTMAEEVDLTGRVIVYTTHLEVAELKREQIRGFGADQLIAGSAGAMSALVEPAQG
jgi:ATP-dependent Clp protease adaptor protein ClpS